MIQYQLIAPETLKKVETDIPKPKKDQVLIKVMAVSICSADMAMYLGKFPLEYPLVMGHDLSGIISEVGEEVSELKVGDRVTVDPQRSCGVCYFCKTGQAKFCEKYSFMGKSGLEGGYQEYIVIEARYVHKLFDNVSYFEASVIEPFAVALHAFDFIKPFIGDTVVISGCGANGLAHVQVAKAMGLKIIALEVLKDRREMASEMGAKLVFEPTEPDLDRLIKSQIRRRAYFIECAGVPASMEVCIKYINRGGILVMSGSCDYNVNLRTFMLKGLTFYAARGGGGTYPRVIELISDGVINPKALITKTFPFKEFEDAMKYNIAHRNEIIKTVLDYQ